MVDTVHPVWGKRNCLKFGIYSEAMDDDQINNKQAKNKRLRYAVVVGMILLASLLVGLLVYGTIGSSSTREKGPIRHLLTLRQAEQPTTTTANTSAGTPATREGTTKPTTAVQIPQFILSDYLNGNVSMQSDLIEQASEELSQTLPYRYISIPDDVVSKQNIRFSNRKYERNSENNAFIAGETHNSQPQKRKEGPSPGFHRTENYPVYLTQPQILRNEPVIKSRIMNNVNFQMPRPFMKRNLTADKPAHNRIKVFKNHPQAALPYYGFASPSKYPQLSNYRYPTEAKNIQDIIQFLTEGDSNKSSPTNKKPETVSVRAPVGNGRKIKFAGVYKTALKEDPNDNYSKPEESVEHAVISGHRNKMSDSSLNGHAYIADPFHAFKPSDPSEVNLLANSNFRFAPFEKRIRFPTNRPHKNRWGVLEINPNDKYFPRPPINFGKPSTAPPSSGDNHDPVVQMYPGTYTSAIYRPFGKEPTETMPHTSTKTLKKMKPLSVMLDIYPMMEDSDSHATAGPHALPSGPLARPGHGYGHRVRFPHGTQHDMLPDQLTDSESKHQMVVHLNLYPKKKMNYNFSNRKADMRGFRVDAKSSTSCCGSDEVENFRTIYEDEAVYDGEEEEAMKVEYKPERNIKDNYKEQTLWNPPEVIHKQDENNVVQTGGTISAESNSGSEVLEQEVADCQEGQTAFEEVLSTEDSQPSRNHGTERDPYSPIDVVLVPATDTSGNVSGIDYEFSKDSSNENRHDTKIRGKESKI